MSKTKLTLALIIANIPVLLAFVFGNWYFLGLVPSVIISVWMIYTETYKLLFPKKKYDVPEELIANEVYIDELISHSIGNKNK